MAVKSFLFYAMFLTISTIIIYGTSVKAQEVPVVNDPVVNEQIVLGDQKLQNAIDSVLASTSLSRDFAIDLVFEQKTSEQILYKLDVIIEYLRIISKNGSI